MIKLSNPTNKNEVFRFISESISFGNLGLFIGAGFSKAVMDEGGFSVALSWNELLEKSSAELDIDYNSIDKHCISYPDLATKICEIYSAQQNIEYKEAVKTFKRSLAALTSWYPNKDKREKYSQYIEQMSANWIMTTNYDLILESLLTGKCIPLAPTESLCSPAGMTPIYHLHGIRSNPDSLIISQEDYIELFRPNEYRQIKLALTMKESTVLLLGYGLGDVNVLTALDWSTNVFSSNAGNYPNETIQIVRRSAPAPGPYRDRNGIVIFETCEIEYFFNEFIEQHILFQKERETQISALKTFSEQLIDPNETTIQMFIDDADYRKRILAALANFSPYVVSGFISLLNKVLDETWKRAEPNGAFHAYNQNITILLDIITTFKLESIPPAVFETIAYNLDKVAYYVGPQFGKSHSAHRTFERQKANLSEEIIAELKNTATQHGYLGLKSLLSRI
ncbi:MAG: SIR2 family protein [Deltaproteobacteria bacterium]|nr:SIR2 family protein [Deltaproteobacteria bacterium]